MSQITEIFEILKSAKSIHDLKPLQIKNESLAQNMGRLQNLYEGLYSYYKDQSIIEKMIIDKVIINAVLEIKNTYAEGSQSEPLRHKLIQLSNDNEIDFDIFPASNVTDQLLEAIN